MAVRHQVTCIIPDGGDRDRRIDSIGGATGGKDGGGPWRLKLDEAIAGIENTTWEFFTLVDGNHADVIVVERENGTKFLKTTADYEEPNNLLSLPTCR